MTDELDILQDKQIDPDALDVEWLDQTNLFYKYSDALNQAMDEKNDQKVTVDEKKEEFEILKAKIELEIRSAPEDFDLEKVTDASVKAALLMDDRYQQAMENLYEEKRTLNEIQSRVNKLYTDVTTISEKKVSLQEIGKLLTQQYFCAPTVPRDLTQEWKRKQDYKQTQSQAREKVKRTKRRRSNNNAGI